MTLLIWQHSAAILEYGRLIGLKKILKDAEYQQARIDSNFKINYPNFLLSKYPNFFTKLLQCPVCMTVWLSIFSVFLVGVAGIPVVFMLTMLSYYTFIYLANSRSGGVQISKAN
jgi:hypothetical protein